MTPDSEFVFGKRILVRGATGSGKSTLARELGEALGLKVIELDAIHWQQPDWQPLPTEEFRAQLQQAIDAAPGGWVVEGNYSVVRDITQPHADTLIWLHLPWRVSFTRMFRRTMQRAARRELLWGVQREELKTQFFSKNSLLWWGIHHHRAGERSSQALFDAMPDVHRYELRSASEVGDLLAAARKASSLS